jgi:hypothetical protein
LTGVSVIYFSCKRLNLLDRAIKSFNTYNTYPIEEFIIANDSGDPMIWEQLRKTYPDYTIICHPENVGLVKSIDLGYEHIKTEYFYHSEDDLECNKSGFIEKSLAIMQEKPMIEEVWLGNWNTHPVEPEIYTAGGVEYRLLMENYQKGQNGFNNFGWHGFSMASSLKRMSDYRKVAPYTDVPYEGTIWHREQAIGERYHDLGYRQAILLDQYVEGFGGGLSEYITGYER